MKGLSRERIRLPGVAVGLILTALYVALRTMEAPDIAIHAWTVAGLLAALFSPLAGLVVLAAIGPFTEAQTETGQITPVPYLVAALGISVAVRAATTRPLPRPSWPLTLALVLLVGTALGVLNSWLRYGPAGGTAAAEMWVAGIGGALTLLLSAAWVAWRGEVWPVYVSIASVTLGAALGLLDVASAGSVRAGGLGWLLRENVDPGRASAMIPAPNAAAAVFVVVLSFGLAMVLLAHVRRLHGAGMIVVLATLPALLLTHSRSGLIALAIVLVLLAARWRRWAGVAAIAGVAIGAGVLVMAGLMREVPVAADEARLDAWAAAIRIWLSDPLLGAGFRSFEWLHAAYGSPALNAPHNEFLRLLAEEGTLIGLAAIAFAAAAVWVLVRRREWLMTGAGAAALGLFIMAAFNNPFLYTQVNVPAFTLLGAGLGAVLASSAPSAPATRPEEI